MTRILRLLLIAAVLLPLSNYTTAQDAPVVKEKLSAIEIAPLKNKVAQQSAAEVIEQQASDVMANQAYKTVNSNPYASQANSPRVIRATKSRAAVPEGFAQVTLTAGKVWPSDETGYQMLLDANHDTYGTTIPVEGPLAEGDVPAETYDLFEYKIPENADGAVSTTNIVYENSITIQIPAGTYDWCITNPEPGGNMWIAAEHGDVQGRYDDFVFESGFSYTFTLSFNESSGNDQVDIEITTDHENITDLAVSNIYADQARLSWAPGDDETSWNVEYKKKEDFAWTTAETVNTTVYKLLNLEAETVYQARIQGVYADGVSGWEIISFTTTNEEAPATTKSLDFGSVDANTSKSLIAYVVNENSSAVTVNPTITSPFSVASSVTLQPGQNEVNVTFTPTEGRPYNGTLTIDINGETITITLRGIGSVSGPSNIRDEAFFEGIPYDWTDSEGASHTSNLAEIATDPDQIIAMLREVYMNKNIPGNFWRGYANPDGTYFGTHDRAVQYTGAGEIERTSSNAAQYKDTFGWNIPGTVSARQSGRVDYIYNYYYWYMDPLQYKPNNEGLTLLLLEIQDDFSPTTLYKDANNNITTTASGNTKVIDGVVINNTSGYAQLREIFSKTIKSARIITEAKRTGSGYDAGTLFKIDCDKMNKFYLIAKGQLQWLNSIMMETQSTSYNFYSEPCYLYRDEWWGDDYNYDKYVDQGLHTYFVLGHMFEQFSPSEGSSTELTKDLYWDMVDMKSFGVIHDCPNVPFVENGHHFMMYGVDSESDDCQDVRDLMFFVPDYRMMDWQNGNNGRGLKSNNTTYQDYFFYNPDHKPSMGLFVIKQNPITGEKKQNENTYTLHLSWTSNLLNFLPNEEGQYDLYRVITNTDGTKTYQKIGNFTPDTFNYDDEVPMLQNGQQVTYVVQGQDKEKFLSLQMSNEESYIIPGLDHAEQLRIALNSDYYFSRYDAAAQKNFYSNSVIANNTVGTNVKPNYIKNGSEFKFWRATLKTVEGQTVVDTDNAVNFVTATVGNYSETGGGNLTYGSWTDQADFSTAKYKHGYHANPTTSNITIDNNGEVVFDGLKLYDNFSVGVSGNEHPAQYVYYVTLETAVPFGLDQNLPSFATWQEGQIFAYFETPYNDWNEVRAYAWNGDDVFTDAWAGTELTTTVGTHDNKNVYQWSITARDNGALPANIIFSYKDGYGNWHKTQDMAFANGGYYTITNVEGGEQVTGGIISTITAENTSNKARSNTVSVPVYKTGMTMVPITWNDVEADVTHSKPASTQFTLNTRYSSKDEILGYYIYRWADGETAANARSIYENNGDDSSPQGQAGNQATYYTVAMNTDYTGRTENFVMNESGSYPDVTATFMDNYMVNDAEEADTYTYAPVVELFAPQGSKVLATGAARSDYNTYGGPQDMTAGGIVNVNVLKPGCSTYTWDAKDNNGTTNTYCYYNVYLDVTKLELPTGYEVAKVRAWRKIAPEYLGEEAGKGYEYRKVLDSNGEFMFIEHASCAEGDELGSASIKNNVFEGTFGALKLSSGEEIPMEFIIRVYFTKKEQTTAPRIKAEGDSKEYYIAEYTIPDKLTSDIPTFIFGVENANQVAGVKYYNIAGIESDTPFQGVNIVVTRYTDGTMTTRKVVK